MIVNDFATLEGALAFTQDPSLPAAMAEGGVTARRRSGSSNEADAAAY